MLWLFVGPQGVYLFDFFCSGIQFYLLLSPYLCFISLLYLDLYVLGDDALISKGSFMQTKYRSTSLSQSPREWRKYLELSEVRHSQNVTSPKYSIHVEFVEPDFLRYTFALQTWQNCFYSKLD